MSQYLCRIIFEIDVFLKNYWPESITSKFARCYFVYLNKQPQIVSLSQMEDTWHKLYAY